ncbi:hypothetical protein Q3G72_030639 [Acer saccharum]|nr:hypothetical protein Q3G72_030639 [Acer saccharum]
MFDTIQRLMEETNMTPADVAKNLMPKSPSDDIDKCLSSLIQALQETKEEAKKKKAEESFRHVWRGTKLSLLFCFTSFDLNKQDLHTRWLRWNPHPPPPPPPSLPAIKLSSNRGPTGSTPDEITSFLTDTSPFSLAAISSSLDVVASSLTASVVIRFSLAAISSSLDTLSTAAYLSRLVSDWYPVWDPLRHDDKPPSYTSLSATTTPTTLFMVPLQIKSTTILNFIQMPTTMPASLDLLVIGTRVAQLDLHPPPPLAIRLSLNRGPTDFTPDVIASFLAAASPFSLVAISSSLDDIASSLTASVAIRFSLAAISSSLNVFSTVAYLSRPVSDWYPVWDSPRHDDKPPPYTSLSATTTPATLFMVPL